jgi:hypothetical protein
MSSENSRLGKLLDRRNQIENQIKQIQAKENSRKRKLETRRKILFGIMFEGLIVEGRLKNETITKAIDKHLKTDRDRDLVRNYLVSLTRSDLPQE